MVTRRIDSPSVGILRLSLAGRVGDTLILKHSSAGYPAYVASGFILSSGDGS